MPKTRVLKAGFNRGEIDPKLQRRHDLDWFALSAESVRNFVPLPHGGFKRAFGTRFLSELDPAVQGDVRLVPFRFSTEQRYLFAFHAYGFIVFKGGAEVASGGGPWDDGQVGELSFAQSLDTLIVSHPDFAPRRIRRRGSDAAWALDKLPIAAPPADAFGRRTYSNAYRASGTGQYYVLGVAFIDSSGTTYVTGSTTAGSQTIASLTNGSALAPGARFTLSGEGATVFTALDVSADKTSVLCSPAPSASASQTFTPYEFGPEDVGKWVRMPDGGFAEIHSRTSGDLVGVRAVVTGSAPLNESFLAGTWQVLSKAWGGSRPMGPTVATTVSAPAFAGAETVSVSGVSGIAVGDFVEFSGIDNRVFRVASASGTALGVSPALTMPLAAGAEVLLSRGWPAACAFVEGRLIFGGSKSLPSTVFASAVNDPSDFLTARAEDDDPISYPIVSGDVPAIRHAAYARHLFFLTDAGAYYVPGSDRQALTPATFSVRKTSEHRASRRVRPIETDGALVFVQEDGKSVRALVYADAEAAYNAADLTFEGRHLIGEIRDMALRRSDPDIGSDLLCLVNADGTLAVVTLQREENVTGFCKRVSRDEFTAAATDGDDVVLLASRLQRAGGYRRLRLLERVSFAHLLEASVKEPLSAPASSISGLDHLAYRVVDLILDDVYVGQRTVSGLGVVTLPREASSSYEVGIPLGEVGDAAFSARYPGGSAQAWVRTQRLDFAPPTPTLMGKRKRVSAVTISLQGARHVRVNNRLVAFRSAGEDALDVPVPSFDGEKRVGGMAGWFEDARVDITQTEPAPLTVLALAMEVAV